MKALLLGLSHVTAKIIMLRLGDLPSQNHSEVATYQDNLLCPADSATILL